LAIDRVLEDAAPVAEELGGEIEVIA